MARSTFFQALKRRKWLLGAWLALEIVSIPAGAQVVDHIAFKVEPRVIAAPVPRTEPGLRVFYVASNAPFAVEVGSVVGEIAVSVSLDSELPGFGTHAQMPGLGQACTLGRVGPTQVYRGDTGTAARPLASVDAPIQAQAVRVEIRHDPSVNPPIAIIPAAQSRALPGASCDTGFGQRVLG